jgi:hypothetical protein
LGSTELNQPAMLLYLSAGSERARDSIAQVLVSEPITEIITHREIRNTVLTKDVSGSTIKDQSGATIVSNSSQIDSRLDATSESQAGRPVPVSSNSEGRDRLITVCDRVDRVQD